MSLAAGAGARQVECRPSHRDTSASFGVPLFRRQRRDECKYEGQPVPPQPLDDNFFIHREYITPPSSGSPPASKHSTIGAAAARPSRSAAAIGRYGVAQSQPRRPSPALRWDNRRAGLEGNTGPVKASARLRRTRPLARGLLRHSHDQ